MGNNFNNQNFNNPNNSNMNYNEFNGGNFNYSSQQPEKDPGHGPAIASLVLGILSLLSCCCVMLGIASGVFGVAMAFISKNKSYSGNMESIAKVGMVLSIIGTVFAVGNCIVCTMVAQTPGFWEGYMEALESLGY